MRLWLLLTVLAGCAHNAAPTASDGVQPTEPDRLSLPADVTPAAWNASLKELMPTLGQCRNRQQTPAGRVEVQIEVGINGTPGSIIVYGSQANREMRECISAAFVGAHFPRSQRGGYKYRYPIVFR
jgi:hypothetical protein